MYGQRRIIVVVPAFDVAAHIAGVVKGIPEFVDEILVVEDAGTDATVEVLGGIRDGRLTVVRHDVNQGVGGAMVTGFRLALERDAGVVVKMDGDGQMDPAYLPALLDAVIAEGYAYAKGNRFLDSDQLARMPKTRLFGNFVLTFLTKLVSGYWHVFDPQNGFVAIDARMLRKLPLGRLARRYFFENDMLVQLNVFKARVKDVAIPARYGDEKSSMRLGSVLVTFPVYLFRRFWYRLYQRHVLREFSPVAVFWVLAVCLLTWGTGLGAVTWIKSVVSGHLASTGTVMLSVLPFMLGFQLALQAVLIEIQESPR
jgi:glycosyltransferase involved in cell wall biosynthesis